MYNVRRLVMVISFALIIFTLVISACSKSSTSGSTNPFSKNRLANTTWEGHLTAFGEKSEAGIVFGENSFQLNFSDMNITGTYTISGDAITISYFFLTNIERTGSLIGDKLVIAADLGSSFEFKRVK